MLRSSTREAEEPECEALIVKNSRLTAVLSNTKETQDRMISDVDRLKRDKATAVATKVTELASSRDILTLVITGNYPQ